MAQDNEKRNALIARALERRIERTVWTSDAEGVYCQTHHGRPILQFDNLVQPIIEPGFPNGDDIVVDYFYTQTD